MLVREGHRNLKLNPKTTPENFSSNSTSTPPAGVFSMDEDTKRRVESTVMEILRSADIDQTTEHQIRSAAGDRLGIDLSPPEHRRFVRTVVEAFILSLKEQQKQDEEREKEADEEWEEVEDRGRGKGKHDHRQEEFDDEGNPIICHLSSKRRVTVQDFRGKTLVSIREYYERDGKQLPSSKGISLTTDQWRAFRAAVPSIEDAIAKLK